MSARESEGKIAGYVMAGGESSRFGSDKALAELGGKPMILRMAELLGQVAKETFVVGGAEKHVRLGVNCISDRWPGQGPLGGIITALLHSQSHAADCAWNLIVSCDMPFLTVDWLKFLAERAARSSAQVLLPHSASGPEPLCACYRTDAAERLRSVFEPGVRKITEALKQLETEVLDERDCKRFDTSGRLFWNMNTLADCEEARRILGASER